MKKFLKNDLYIVLTLFFLALLFIYNINFKDCILNGCILFFESVFPSLLPMFVINDLLMNYNFFSIIDKFISKGFKKIFHTSSACNYIFILSMFSGTPTNGYIAANLVKDNKISPKDAGIVLSYAFFLNPLFLYNILNRIFNCNQIAIKLILIHYSINFIIAFLLRNYKYTFIKESFEQKRETFTKILSQSIKHAFDTLTIILGTILFYFILCEGINIFIKNPLLNCITNGLLEATGGLSKLINLNLSIKAKELVALLFISFGGFSIHSQIKNIITDVHIPYKYLFFSRIFHIFLSTITCIIIP